MKNNSQKGFIVPVLLGIIAVLIIGGGVYFYTSKKVDAPVVTEEKIKEEIKDDNINKIDKILQKDNSIDYSKFIKSPLFGQLDFSYPEGLKSVSYDEPFGTPVVSLSHSLPYKHVNSCDMKDGLSIDTATDFSAQFKLYNISLIDSLKKDNPNGYTDMIKNGAVSIQPGFVDKYKLGSVDGYKISMGVEGCGYFTYYFPISTKETLVIKRDYYLQSLQVGREKLNNVPGFISASEEEIIFNKILNSFVGFNQPNTLSVQVYFRKGVSACSEKNINLEYFHRIIPKTEAVARAAIDELLKGPTQEEKNTGYWSDIPEGTIVKSITIKNGEATIDLNEKIEAGVTTCNGGGTRTSQITKTLMQFPTIKSVKFSVNGQTEGIFQP